MSSPSSAFTVGIFSPLTCQHLNPALFSEKLPKQSNLTLHQVINLLGLPPVVNDHIISLFTKHKFSLQHFPYLTMSDLVIILKPPFPTPPLQCPCQPINILADALQTIAFRASCPTVSPATSRETLISSLEAYEAVTLMTVHSPADVLSRITAQTKLRTLLLTFLPQQLDVNVTIPQHKNLVMPFDLDRVIDDLNNCYTLYLQEREADQKKKDFELALVDLGIEIPNSETPTLQPTEPLAPLDVDTTSATPTLAIRPKPDLVMSVGGPNSAGPRKVTSRPLSGSLRPSQNQKYHTLNLRCGKETNVSLTRLDSFGNHTPLYGDEVFNSAQITAEALASPSSSIHSSHSIFNTPKPSKALERFLQTSDDASIPGSTPSPPPSTPNASHRPITPKYPTLGRILSNQPSSLSTRPTSDAYRFDGIKPLAGAPITTTASSTSHTTPTPPPSSGTGLFAKAQQSYLISNKPISNAIASASAGTTSPSVTNQISSHQSPSHGPMASSSSVDSFNLFSQRTRSGTNPNLSQLADRFAIGNTSYWVPYWKKTPKQLEEMLTSWDFSLFNDIGEQHRSEILLRLSVFMFVNCGVVEALPIPLDKLTRFLHHVSTLYRDNPYHNFLHAWTTLHYTYLLIKHTSSNRRIEYSHTVIFSMLLASICHDVDHPGNNNNFEVLTNSKLALLHNDNSVLENHHAFVTFSLLSRAEFSLLGSVSKQTVKDIRTLIISIILNTDMALHNDLTDAFGKASEDLLLSNDTVYSNEGTLSVRTTAAFSLIARVLVHCSDISGQALPLVSAYPWAIRLRDEFLNQSDTEARLGLPITPFMSNLDDLTFAKSQLGFIRGVLRPLWVRMSITFPSTKPSLQHISANEAFWNDYVEACERSPGQTQSNRNFSITSTLAPSSSRPSTTTPQFGRKYTLDEHFIRHLQEKELYQVPEAESDY